MDYKAITKREFRMLLKNKPKDEILQNVGEFLIEKLKTCPKEKIYKIIQPYNYRNLSIPYEDGTFRQYLYLIENFINNLDDEEKYKVKNEIIWQTQQYLKGNFFHDQDCIVYFCTIFNCFYRRIFLYYFIRIHLQNQII